MERKKYRDFEEALVEAHAAYNFHKYFGWDGEENPNFDDSMISLYDKKNKIEIPYSLLKERNA